MIAGRRGLVYFAAAFLLVSLLNPLAGHVALKRLEKKAGAPIRGTFIPHVLFPAFTLKNASFDWQGRFQVVSGTVEVRYNPLFLIPGQKFRVWIEARKLPVRFSGGLAESQGFSRATLEHVVADMAFPHKGSPEIFLLDIHSPEMTFRLVKEPGKNHPQGVGR